MDQRGQKEKKKKEREEEMEIFCPLTSLSLPLSPFLPTSSSLIGNNIGPEGVRLLADVLTTNTTLKELE